MNSYDEGKTNRKKNTGSTETTSEVLQSLHEASQTLDADEGESEVTESTVLQTSYEMPMATSADNTPPSMDDVGKSGDRWTSPAPRSETGDAPTKKSLLGRICHKLKKYVHISLGSMIALCVALAVFFIVYKIAEDYFRNSTMAPTPPPEFVTCEHQQKMLTGFFSQEIAADVHLLKDKLQQKTGSFAGHFRVSA
ncbi:hypothetical protein BIW11_13844 [Tropilaelaps mercedesae]|uniref:Uncharacterized protein n=1 Tax=Tropilaelaps mercedesae TaxID=418985 RepID=A0A1V9X061_9ACAR|nr:hypothetical protein BIW11_13844 [Tropilaelaps mercedesae]